MSSLCILTTQTRADNAACGFMPSYNARLKMIITILLALAAILPPALAQSTSTSSSSAAATPIIVQTAGGFSYIGCYTDSTSSRGLTGASYQGNSKTTVESCALACSGFVYFGLEWSQVCSSLSYLEEPLGNRCSEQYCSLLESSF